MIKDLPAPSRPATRPLRVTPARRAVLAVGVPVAAAIIGATAFSLVADVGTGHYPLKYTIPISDGRLTMNAGGGDLALQGTSGSGAAHLTGTVDYTFVRPQVSLTHPGGQGTVFSFRCRISIGNCALNSTAAIPAATAATISTDGGNLSASDLTGAVSLSSDGGNLAATDLAGNASLQTGGGDLTAVQLTGDAHLGTNGGNITATSIDSPRVTADSGGGDVEIVFTRIPQYVQVAADGGNVTIVVPDVPGGYDVTTSTDGGNLNESVPVDTSSPRKITASSGGGDITIEQSP